jgi:K+-sensing histidine kinase KdpD
MDYPQGKDFTDLATLQLAYDRLLHQAQHQAGFLGTASHELRAPINQIISLHQLILEDLCENPAEEREFIAQANQTIQIVLKNLDLLITLSKFDIGTFSAQMQPTPLAPILTRLQRQVEMQCINRHCRFTLEPVDDALTLATDAAWLEQVLIMLVEAALGQGSTQIGLTVEEEAATSTVALHLKTDPSLAPPTPVPAFSPEFRRELVARLIPHLGGSLETLDTHNALPSHLCLRLPQGHP